MPASTKKTPVDIGEVLAGKFRVERVLGVGGMGVVVAATHLQLDKMVALKFMHEEESQDPEVAARFAREAKAAARLHTRHISKVLDVGALENGAPYMVMEYLEGCDLRDLMKERKSSGKGPLPVARAAEYIMQACLGMSEAHAHGFVHRDLKPPNLFLTRGADGRPLIKILDFGIAKAYDDGIDTATQAVMGSPAYMSPEQWGGARYVDERGDIWALGAILQYLLSGRAPFYGESLPVLFNNISSCEPRSLADPKLGVPPALQAVIRRCLSKDAQGRPQSAAELAALLAPFAPEEALEFAAKAARVENLGPEGTIMGRGAYHTPAYQIGADMDVTVPDEPSLGPTGGTTLSRAGTLPGVAAIEETPPSRLWLALGGLAGIAIAAIAVGQFGDDSQGGESTTPSASNSVSAASLEPSPEIAGDVQAGTPEMPLPVMTTITLSTQPTGAEVRVNGVRKGESPLELSFPVGSTPWLRFDMKGYASLEQALDVQADLDDQEFTLLALADEKVGDSMAADKSGASGQAEENDKKKRQRSDRKRSRDKSAVIESEKTQEEKIRSSADRRH